MKVINLENEIWKLVDTYKNIVLGDNILPSVIRVVFSKYAVDKYLYAETTEEMMYYADAQKAIVSGDAFEFFNALQPIYDMLDNKINTNGLLRNIPHQMINDIFRKTMHSAEDSQRSIMRIISDIDCTSNDNESLFDILISLVYSFKTIYGRRSDEIATNKSVNILVSKLLNVNENDTFKDFACGYGLSSLEIIKNNVRKIYLSDINEENIQIAIMLFVIKNIPMNKCFFESSNIFDDNNYNNELVTKIFVDFPFNLKVNKDRYGTSDGNVLAIKRIIENLDSNGKAIITCPSGLLFRENKEVLDLRKELTQNNLIEAIITLPSVMTSTIVNVNLIIISKAKNNSNVVLIDASDNKYFQFSNNARSNKTELTTEGINKISEIVNTKETIIGISKVVSNKELNNNKSFVPANYIESPKTGLSMSYAEINERLNVLYDKLKSE